MQLKRKKLTRRQRSEIERVDQNARAKRREWHEASRRGDLLGGIFVIAICFLIWLLTALSPLGHVHFPSWIPIVALTTVFFVIGLRSLVHELRAKRWPATTCKIEFNDVVSERSRYLTTWRPVVSYVYEVDGKQYTNDVIRIINRDFTRASAEAYASSQVPGSTRRCFYNPANPQDSVLERGIRLDVPILFMGIGIGTPIWIYMSL
jgi:hypothetical protein